MYKSRKFWFSSIFLIGLIISTYLGTVVYQHDVRPRITAAQTKISFQLLEANGQLMSFPELNDKGNGLILVHLPDGLGPDFQAEFGRFTQKISRIKNTKNMLILVSRLEPDDARNLKRVTMIKTPLLIDPSGSILRKIIEWSPDKKLRDWITVELSRNGEIKRVASGTSAEESWLQ
jgi:hypothetical protein